VSLSRIQRLVSFCLIFCLGWASSWWFYYHDNNFLDKISSEHADRVVNKSPQNLPQNKRPVRSKHTGTPHKKQSEYDRAVLLLANRQYTQFIQMYIGLRAIADEALISRYQSLVLDTVKKLQLQKSYQKSLELLSLFLEYEYDNSEALLLFAELQHTQKNYLASMDALFRARSYAHQNNTIDAVNKKLRALVDEQRSRLNKTGDKLALLDFYRRLTELEPDYALNFVGLADVYLSLGNSEDARNALSMASHDPSVSDRVERMYAKIDQAPVVELTAATSVPLLRLHDQFLIDVTINNQQSARLLLDTGASISIISPSVLNALGLSSQRASKMGWFNTANGVVSAPIYSLQNLSVDNHQVETVDVGVLSVSDSDDIDGLLGMNFLKHFKFYIDQQNNILFLQ
jgi:clan AA aspartic protease (TIGR02281 family)